MLAGGLAGVAAGIAVGYTVYAGLLRIPLRWFFTVTGILVLFLAAGKMTSDFHIRFIAPIAPPRGPGWAIALACATIVAIGLLTRLGYYLSRSAA